MLSTLLHLVDKGWCQGYGGGVQGWRCASLQVAESEAVLACRLISRKTEVLEKMIMRVQTARQEMRHLPEFDYGARRSVPATANGAVHAFPH